jgi:2-amino-4-hydroxy-6-hydroxymethyldihydropteridine diphosphokinase
MSDTTFVALGSNMPFEGAEPRALLALAVRALDGAGLQVRARSGIWQTAAWPSGDQPDYFNAVVELDRAGLEPQLLYEVLAGIERRFGRDRREKWASRTLDLDIVAMDGFVGVFGGVELPHPRMAERAFVLAPLAEIAPGWRHPGTGLNPAEMLANVPADYRYYRLVIPGLSEAESPELRG